MSFYDCHTPNATCLKTRAFSLWVLLREITHAYNAAEVCVYPEENNRPKSIFNTQADTSSWPIRIQAETGQVNGREIYGSNDIYGTMFCSESPLSWK